MSFKEFFRSKIFFKNLGLSVGVFIICLLLTVVILNLYTRHGNEKSLPSFVGMQIAQIDQIMDDLDFSYEVTDSVFDIKMTPGRIYDQYPAAGSMVKTHRTILLSIYSSTPVMSVVPDLKDQSARNAEGELRENGFVVGEISYVPSEYTNLVLDQKFNGRSLVAGTKLPKGTAIELVVGKSGSADRTKIPDLSGLSLNEAKSYVQGQLLNVGSFIFDETVKSAGDSVKAVVYKQSPQASESSTLPLGTTIDMWLTIDYTKIE